MELESIAIEFGKWKSYARDPLNFVLQILFEGLIWMVFGLKGVAKTYLDMNGMYILAQEQSGLDALEYLFGEAVMSNSNANSFEMHAFSAKST
eukprot:11781893-Ditylum_brightwellii.AAC.1